MLLFGTGPGLYVDLAAFIFHVPNSDSWACASRVPASTRATARLIRTRMVLGFILHLSYVNVFQAGISVLGSQADDSIHRTMAHKVIVARLRDRLDGGGKSPNELVAKKRLREMLGV